MKGFQIGDVVWAVVRPEDCRYDDETVGIIGPAKVVDVGLESDEFGDDENAEDDPPVYYLDGVDSFFGNGMVFGSESEALASAIKDREDEIREMKEEVTHLRSRLKSLI